MSNIQAAHYLLRREEAGAGAIVRFIQQQHAMPKGDDECLFFGEENHPIAVARWALRCKQILSSDPFDTFLASRVESGGRRAADLITSKQSA